MNIFTSRDKSILLTLQDDVVSGITLNDKIPKILFIQKGARLRYVSKQFQVKNMTKFDRKRLGMYRSKVKALDLFLKKHRNLFNTELNSQRI